MDRKLLESHQTTQTTHPGHPVGEHPQWNTHHIKELLWNSQPVEDILYRTATT